MTSVSVSVEGIDALLGKMKALGANSDDVTIGAISDVVLATHGYAVSGIHGGPKTGRTYTRGTVSHRASAPGEYPATDTGALVASIALDLPTKGKISGMVGSSITYATMLEFGTSRMAARPWLLPSFEKAKGDVEADLRRRFEAMK